MAALKYGLDCTLILTTDQNPSEINYGGNYFIYDLLDVKIKTVPLEKRQEQCRQSILNLNRPGKSLT